MNAVLSRDPPQAGYQEVEPHARASCCWDGSAEMWANFIAYHAIDIGVVPNFVGNDLRWDYDRFVDLADEYPGLPSDLAVKMLDYQIAYGHDVMRTFFRKYVASDPALEATVEEQQQLLVTRLAESVQEVSGNPGTYAMVVQELVALGFPQP